LQRLRNFICRNKSIEGDIEGFTIHQLDTPFHNPDSEEVTTIVVTDPTHPLFGRHFQLLSISTPLNSPAHAFVRYREKMVLRIPVTATNLAPPRTAPRTKLTSQAIEEFLSLANQCEVLCQPNRKTSGADFPQALQQQVVENITAILQEVIYEHFRNNHCRIRC
jgi:hypothetical protein